MADTKATKSAKTKPEQNAAAPPAPAATLAARPSAARSRGTKSAAEIEKTPASRVKAKSESLQSPEAPAKRKVRVATAAKAAPSEEPRAAAKVPAAEMPDPQETYRMIAEAAYYLAEKRNFAPGWEQEDWETARKEVMAQLDKRKA